MHMINLRDKPKPMEIQKYNLQQPKIASLLTWIESGEIAIPENQRPFVWDSTKVSNLLDSIYMNVFDMTSEDYKISLTREGF